MSSFIIKGNRRLEGTFRPRGNKNAALPMLAATVMTDKPVVLQNVPIINDVLTMCEILVDLGATVERRKNTVTICAASLRKRTLPADLCRKVRSSILFAGPLAARHGSAKLPPPGGDVIGRRRLDTHFAGLKALGIKVCANHDYRLKCTKLKGADLLLDEASVTATENVLMAACLAKGRTVIFNAACEPHVQDLCHLLNKMGAQIEGIGTNRLQIQGVRKLRGATHRIQPDHIEIGSFIAAAAVTGGSLDIPGVNGQDLAMIAPSFAKLGLCWQIKGKTLHLPGRQKLAIADDLGAAIPKIEDGIWPAFPSDLMSIAIVLATRAKGTILIFEKMFESRMYFVDRLISMGAKLVQCDPHRVIVTGPARLQATHLESPDIRAGMALLVAALCAKGESIIDNAETIDRGYECIEEKLAALGASISRKR